MEHAGSQNVSGQFESKRPEHVVLDLAVANSAQADPADGVADTGTSTHIAWNL
jgi:hypothetical protein